MKEEIKNIMITRGWEESQEDFDLPNGIHEDFPSFTNTGNSECIIPKAILEEIWKEAQKELLEEMLKDNDNNVNISTMSLRKYLNKKLSLL